MYVLMYDALPTVTVANYPEMLRTLPIPDMRQIQNTSSEEFLQDRAPHHWNARAYLDVTFPEPLTARSPDITPLDFFVWICQGQSL